MKLGKISNNSQILIYGYGKEGKSSEAFLSKKFPTAFIQIYDEDPFQKVENNLGPCPCFQKGDCKFDVVVVSPGVPREKLSHIDSHKLTSNTELFFDNLTEDLRKKIIGISGTKGKSTTTKFCAEMLKKSKKNTVIGGNYGVPLLDLYDDFCGGKYDYIVAELSSFQLENLNISPGISIFLNLYHDHLDRHHTKEHYLLSKQNLWKYQGIDDYLIVPKKNKSFIEGKCISQLILSSSLDSLCFPSDSVFRAAHFLENFGTVKALASLLDISDDVLKQTAGDFHGLPYRTEFFANKKGFNFYDDSISTNPDTSIAAIKFFGKNLGAILIGGRSGGGVWDVFFEVCAQIAPQAQIWVLYSETSVDIMNTAKKLSFNQAQIKQENDFYDFLTLHLSSLKAKNIVLSPGAKSFDRFKNYQKRGQHWKSAVKKWGTS